MIARLYLFNLKASNSLDTKCITITETIIFQYSISLLLLDNRFVLVLKNLNHSPWSSI